MMRLDDRAKLRERYASASEQELLLFVARVLITGVRFRNEDMNEAVSLLKAELDHRIGHGPSA